MKMSKEDTHRTLLELAQMCEDRYFGDTVETQQVFDKLEKQWESKLTYDQWRLGVMGIIDDLMRVGASLGQWTKRDSDVGNSVAKSAFDAIQDDVFPALVRAVQKEHASPVVDDSTPVTLVK